MELIAVGIEERLDLRGRQLHRARHHLPPYALHAQAPLGEPPERIAVEAAAPPQLCDLPLHFAVKLYGVHRPPVAASSMVALLPAEFATQMLAPSSATPYGLLPTGQAPASAAAPLPADVFQLSFSPRVHPSRAWESRGGKPPR